MQISVKELYLQYVLIYCSIHYRNDVFLITTISLAAVAVTTFIVKIHYLTLCAHNIKLLVGYKSNNYGDWISMIFNKKMY